ncbi:MAG: tRNA (adenosine(37)-N6)-threonylcarbamoyltransferase complex dimerization subunit type 1 TsaB [Ruminococcaceae bacterium]|nr:tRNA (adenosine(37)-N6)-threonylcarbamoyltransferase complex dimerization subunit type 1 TsaB [Oscillospiraceae bacterium]
MIVLAMESSAIVASVAVCNEERVLGEYTLCNGNTHSETLLPMIESLLHFLGLTVNDVDLFAVSAGPGSFTGVRIGVATMKGLAFGSGKPCVGVSTLEALAHRYQIPSGLICPVMNARRKQVYTALFRAENGQLTRLMEDSAISVEELDERLNAYGEPISFVGDGYDLVKTHLKHFNHQTPANLRDQSASAVAYAALRAYNQGKYITDSELAPVYLRPCQAERERAEREAMKKEGATP